MNTSTKARVALLSLALLAGAAKAEVLQFAFTGTVDFVDGIAQTGMDVSPGSLIEGSFSYDTATPVRDIIDQGRRTTYLMPAAQDITVTVGGHSLRADKPRIDIFDSGIFFIMAAHSPTVDGVASGHGLQRLSLILASYSGNVLPTGALPTQLDLSAFDLDRSGSILFSGDGIISFSVNSLTAIPEPASAMQWGLGLLGLGFVASRKAVARNRSKPR